MKFDKTQFTVLIVMVSVVVCLLVVDVLSSETWYDRLSDEQKEKIYEATRTGMLHEGNIDQFLDRLIRSPNLETAVDQAFDGSLGARLARDWHSIKSGFADPTIGINALKEQYSERGPVKGPVHIVWRVLTSPVRTWGQILSGKGLGERPLGTLVWFVIGVLIIGKVAVRLARVIGPLIVPIPKLYGISRWIEFGN